MTVDHNVPAVQFPRTKKSTAGQGAGAKAMDIIDRIRSEYLYLTGALRTLKRVTAIAKASTRTISDAFDDLEDSFGPRVALLNETETLTFHALNQHANQYARWAIGEGVQKGETVALFMHNRPEYLAIWLGIVRMGGVVALINTNLAGKSLAHCINIVSPRHIIVGAGLDEALETATPHLTGEHIIWSSGDGASGGRSLDSAIAPLDDQRLPADQRPALTINDRCLYIYTSGTTGLPKAANINHYRVQAIMNGFSAATQASADDRMYNCLPLYHSAGGLIATGSVLTVGGSCVIRERFSARQFWDDVVSNDCTMFQYIGELCRYLVNSPTHPNETKHKIRLCNGNGLRPDIWLDFKTRFKLPNILEWYASTEGNAVFFNFDERPGAVGRIPKWAERRFVTEVVKYDIESETQQRDPNGFCIKCEPNEVGEVISKIIDDPSKPSQRFEGYSDDTASEKKILRDVFEKGDAWFTTGDLMRKDEHGYFYFIDRIGDTFRWKGENVATSEVSEAITVFPGIKEANVYGVHVPGHDGRAGMAALTTDGEVDCAGLYAHVRAQLPEYARPIFLRILSEMDITGTFKIKKTDLVKEGFNPATIEDRLYVADDDAGAYVPMTADAYNAIETGATRF